MKNIDNNGGWEEQKKQLRKKFAALTENDILFSPGRKEEMLINLQIKLGKTKEEMQKIISTI